ncbi:MAG TPA: phytoene desaturase family protein [Longimicrobiales bacterium]|nr:phytoene desaturase family protein [Longimicrobiales bacterium]
MSAPGQPPVVVIGAGFGGLAAAVRLRALGHRVLVLEARDQAGGRAGVYRRDGYTFDAGPTVITAPYLLAELFELLGRDFAERVELVPVDPFYRILFHDGSTFDYVGEEDRLIENIRALSPRDVDGYRRLATRAREIFDVGYTQLADRPFLRFTDMIRILPDLVRLGGLRSVYSLVADHIEDDRLRRAFTFEPLLVGGHPFRASGIYLLIHWLERRWGVHFAKGGTAAIVEALVDLLEEVDVEVRLSTPVERIEVERGRAVAVHTEGGERVPCAFVVSNGDPSRTYRTMIPEADRGRNRDARVRRVQKSMSLFVGHFGVRRTYPDIAHHTIVLGERYRGLLDDIFRRRVLADDFSLYVHAPTRTDPSMAPPGNEAMYVLSPVPNNRSGIDWDREGERYFDAILSELEERLLPGLRAHLDLRFHVTPDYFEHELRTDAGAAFGPEPILTQSAWFRYHNRSPDVDGLYFVGAGTHPGAGVPGVLNSARVLERIAPRPTAGSEIPVPGERARV